MAPRAHQCSLICQVSCERRCQYSTHGYPMPRHPISVHSRVTAPVINYKPRLGSHFLKKWTSGFRTSIWVGLIHPASFPGPLPHRLWAPRTNLAALPSFSTHCSSLLSSTSRWWPSGFRFQAASLGKRVKGKKPGFQRETDQDSSPSSTRQRFSFIIYIMEESACLKR